jgi:D-alanyl-D-alanine carboxypeptidase
VLLDDASGAVLYQSNAHAQLAPASLTKIATAAVALERGNLDGVVEAGEVDSRTFPPDSTVMGLLPGDRFSLRDLLYGLMLPSGNDAAIVIGRTIAGSDPAFVDDMNALASRLGLRDTHFANAHGLAAIAHYSSAYDLAVLCRYAMTLPEFRTIASADQWTAHGSRDLPMYSLITDTRWRIPGSDAGKSGFTDSAGRTLVISAERDGHRLYAVLLNDKYTEDDAAALIDWGFANFAWTPDANVSRETSPASDAVTPSATPVVLPTATPAPA